MYKLPTGLVTGILLFTATAWLITGCGSRATSAQKLFDNGQYQEVINKYPDLEVARRAHAKLADQLLANHQLDSVIVNFADTPAAFKARLEKAQRLFDQGKYQAVIDSFPFSPLAATAKQRMADSLAASGQTDLLLQRFPDSPQAKQIKEERGTADLAKAKKMKGADKTRALEDIARNYSGTDAAKEANDMLFKIHTAENQKSQISAKPAKK